MACCASISPREQTCLAGAWRTSSPSRPRSTADRARSSTGRLPPRFSTSSYGRSTKPVLQRPVETRQYTSWAFGQRLREAGLLGSMGSIGDCFDNGLAASFFATLQTELLDRHTWTTREQLANAVFAYLEGFYNPRRRHSALNYLSPADYETDWHRQQHKTAA